MGQLSFPAGTRVYLDTSPIIYSVEKHLDYWPILEPLWIAAKSSEIKVLSSELTLLEVLVLPFRLGNQPLIEAYEELLVNSDIELVPIGSSVLRTAARLRSSLNLKTPDAIHAATAAMSGCDHFVSNDTGFRRLTTIEVVVLSEFL